MQHSNNSRVPISFNAHRSYSEALGFDMPSEVSVGALLRTLKAYQAYANCLELGTGKALATCRQLNGLDEHERLTAVNPNALQSGRAA